MEFYFKVAIIIDFLNMHFLNQTYLFSFFIWLLNSEKCLHIYAFTLC